MTSTDRLGLKDKVGDVDYDPFHIEMDKSPPHSPMALRVMNVTHNWAHLSWAPRYNNRLVQNFKIKYIPVSDRDDVRHYYVYPRDTNSKILQETWLMLKPGTSYEISIMAYNDFGESPYSEALTATTLELNTSKYWLTRLYA